MNVKGVTLNTALSGTYRTAVRQYRPVRLSCYNWLTHNTFALFLLSDSLSKRSGVDMCACEPSTVTAGAHVLACSQCNDLIVHWTSHETVHDK